MVTGKEEVTEAVGANVADPGAEGYKRTDLWPVL